MKKERNRNWKNICSRFILAAAVFAIMPWGLGGCGSSERSKEGSGAYETAEAVGDSDAAYGMQSNGAMKSEAGASDFYDEAAESESYDGAEDAEEKLAAGGTENGSSTAAMVTDAKKIIKRYYFDYETEEFDSAVAYLKTQIEKYNGYISSSNVNGTSYRTLNLTARIPADLSDEFTGQLGSLGTLTSQSESAEDITLQYTDTESRIKSLKTEQERLNALLEKADDLESIITLENRMTEVRYELENYQSRKNLYDDLVSYSTVNITLEEVNYTVAVDDSSFLSRITTGLESTFRDIKVSIADFLVWFIVNLPYIIIWVLIIFVIVKVMRMLLRRRKRKLAELDENTDMPVEEQNHAENEPNDDTAAEEETELDKE